MADCHRRRLLRWYLLLALLHIQLLLLLRLPSWRFLRCLAVAFPAALLFSLGVLPLLLLLQ